MTVLLGKPEGQSWNDMKWYYQQNGWMYEAETFRIAEIDGKWEFKTKVIARIG